MPQLEPVDYDPFNTVDPDLERIARFRDKAVKFVAVDHNPFDLPWKKWWYGDQPEPHQPGTPGPIPEASMTEDPISRRVGAVAEGFKDFVMRPGEVAAGRADPDDIAANLNMALNMTGGAGLIPAGKNELRAGFGGKLDNDAFKKLAQFERLEKKGAPENILRDITGLYRDENGAVRAWKGEEEVKRVREETLRTKEQEVKRILEKEIQRTKEQEVKKPLIRKPTTSKEWEDYEVRERERRLEMQRKREAEDEQYANKVQEGLRAHEERLKNGVDYRVPYLIGPKVPTDFSEGIKRDYYAVPVFAQRALKYNGTQAFISERLVDQAAYLAGKLPRGWPSGSTWEMVAGVCRQGNEVHVARTVLDRFSGGYIPANTPRGTFHHELGHAFDNSLDRASSREAFLEAYHKDVNRIPAQDRPRYNYFLQPGVAGPSETFAEMFSSTIRPIDPNFAKLFPRTHDFMQFLISGGGQ